MVGRRVCPIWPQELGKPEIEDLDRLGGGRPDEEDVRRFQISMKDVMLMGEVDAGRDLFENVQRFRSPREA